MLKEEIQILQDIKERLDEGAHNSTLRQASLLLSKKEVDILYQLCINTINSYEMMTPSKSFKRTKRSKN